MDKPSLIGPLDLVAIATETARQIDQRILRLRIAALEQHVAEIERGLIDELNAGQRHGKPQ